MVKRTRRPRKLKPPSPTLPDPPASVAKIEPVIDGILMISDPQPDKLTVRIRFPRSPEKQWRGRAPERKGGE